MDFARQTTIAAEPVPHGTERFIGFQLGGETFYVAAAGVLRVVQPMQVAALPNSPTWLLGLAAHRGEIVAILDPSRIWSDASPSTSVRTSKMLIFHPAAQNLSYALPIDRLDEIVAVPPHHIPSKSGRRDGGLFYEIDVADRTMRVIDHVNLFTNFNFSETAQ